MFVLTFELTNWLVSLQNTGYGCLTMPSFKCTCHRLNEASSEGVGAENLFVLLTVDIPLE